MNIIGALIQEQVNQQQIIPKQEGLTGEFQELLNRVELNKDDLTMIDDVSEETSEDMLLWPEKNETQASELEKAENFLAGLDKLPLQDKKDNLSEIEKVLSSISLAELEKLTSLIKLDKDPLLLNNKLFELSELTEADINKFQLIEALQQSEIDEDKVDIKIQKPLEKIHSNIMKDFYFRQSDETENEKAITNLVERITALPIVEQAELLTYLKQNVTKKLLDKLENNNNLVEEADHHNKELMATMERLLVLITESSFKPLESAIQEALPIMEETDADEIVVEELELLAALIEKEETQFINNTIIQVQEWISSIKEILQTNNPRVIRQNAGSYLQILKQWSQISDGKEAKLVEQMLTEELTDKELTIFKQTFQTFEKRSFLQTSNMYQNDAAITKQDVTNWLEQAFARHNVEAKVEANQAISSFRAVTSELAQYDFHLNMTQKVERVSEELVQKLTTAVKEVKLLTTPNMQQLTLQLRPESLGNIIVRLTQVDGEMVVKIIVTTEAARKALEANTHQLKQTFAPHQISIEKNEQIIEEEFLEHQEKKDQEQEEGKEKQEEKQSKQQEEVEESFLSFLERIEKGALLDDEN